MDFDVEKKWVNCNISFSTEILFNIRWMKRKAFVSFRFLSFFGFHFNFLFLLLLLNVHTRKIWSYISMFCVNWMALLMFFLILFLLQKRFRNDFHCRVFIFRLFCNVYFFLPHISFQFLSCVFFLFQAA